VIDSPIELSPSVKDQITQVAFWVDDSGKEIISSKHLNDFV
jgi:hypothetical protein